MNVKMKWSAFFTAFLLLSQTLASRADNWPTRPITVIVPFTAGTTSDILARAVAHDLVGELRQPFVVENRGGAGGNIGAAAVAKASADGYTILFATTGQAATNKLMYKHMEFDPQRDFAPVVLVGKAPVIIVARKDAPFSSLQEFIAFAKANPNKITAGYPGNGTLGHITGELLLRKGALQFSHTQYKGSAAILTDLMGGHIDIGIDSMAAYVPAVQAGNIKPIAIAAQNRWSKLPNVPTVSESGLPGFEASVWYALLTPAKTAPEVIQKLNHAVNHSLELPNTRQVFDNLGVQASGGSPQDLSGFTKSEVEKWAPIIRDAKIEF